MKNFFYLLLIFVPVIACNNERNKLAGEGNRNEHAGHQDTSAAGSLDTTLHSVVAATNQVVMSDQMSVNVRIIDTVLQFKGYGYITWDIRLNHKIATRTAGRIEKLYVKYNYQYVRKGQKIMEIYTPEVNTYAAEYLHHFTTPGDETLLVKAKEKLELLGVTGQQIKDLEAKGRIPDVISVYSHVAGYVFFDNGNNRMASPMGGNNSSSGDEMGNMSGDNNAAKTVFEDVTSSGQFREGMYVNRNQTLFYINDFTKVWGLLSFDENTASFIRKGTKVIIKSELLEAPVQSTVSFIENSFNSANQKFIQMRAYLSNASGNLKINSLIEGVLDVPLKGQMTIPAESVLSLGKRKMVWVKTGSTISGKNIFKARDIQLSLMDRKVAVVASGLSSTEEIAADAGYLLDSQSLIEQ